MLYCNLPDLQSPCAQNPSSLVLSHIWRSLSLIIGNFLVFWCFVFASSVCCSRGISGLNYASLTSWKKLIGILADCSIIDRRSVILGPFWFFGIILGLLRLIIVSWGEAAPCLVFDFIQKRLAISHLEWWY